MSKEFEEIVLKKLEKLDTLENNVKGTDNLIKEEILKKLEKLDTLEKNVKETDALIKEMKKDNAKRFGNLEMELKDTQEVVTEIRQRFIKFDYEINKKIDTLFDANTINQEKHSSLEDKIVSLDAKSFNHDIRISNLEDKVLTA